jgi:hypothetical protein
MPRNPLRRRKALAPAPDFKRQFFLEGAEPGRWRPCADDDVQTLIADGPGDAENLSDLTPPTPDEVRANAARILAKVPEVLRGPTPLADELRRDITALETANDRLLNAVRAYRKILLGLGFTQQGLDAIEKGSDSLDDTVPMPRVRSLAAPLAVADGELLVQPLPGREAKP